MTTGSTSTGSFRNSPFILDGRSLGNIPKGRVTTRTWSGGDSKSPHPYITQSWSYHTVTKSGRTVKRTRSYRVYSKKKRYLPPNPYSVTYSSISRPPCGLQFRDYYPATGQTFVRNYANYTTDSHFGNLLPPPPAAFDANDQIRLIGKLSDAVRGGDFNPSVFFAEANQSVRMVADTAVRLARAYHLFRKGDVVAAARTLPYGRTVYGRQATKRAAASNSWLELQYGWMPLLQDMKSGAEFISHQLNVPFKRRFVARISKKTDLSALLSAMRWINPSVYVSSRERQLVAYVSEPLSLPQLSGLLDPELVAWEIVPFSFVVDWFLPVGDYLNARAFARRLSGTFVTTDRTLREYSGFASKPWNEGSHTETYVLAGGLASARRDFTLSRAVSTSLSVPTPVLKGLDKALSVGHLTNALALLGAVTTTASFNRGLQRKLDEWQS